MHIVLVEDNLSLQKGIAYRLRDDGHVVDALDNGADAEVFLRQEPCDLVILDINLPGASGLDVLRGLRARDDARPVILLTARASTAERVAGLDAGADDYLVKPFAMDELSARVRALSRRQTERLEQDLALGPLRLNLERLHLSHEGTALDVPRRELTVLGALARAKGRPVGKDVLLDAVYGTGSETDEQVIEVYVSRLRKRLGAYGVRIRVTRGIGYSLQVEPA
ncbi:MAG: response regulator transcription factor [Pseudomonadota bacterium]